MTFQLVCYSRNEIKWHSQSDQTKSQHRNMHQDQKCNRTLKVPLAISDTRDRYNTEQKVRVARQKIMDSVKLFVNTFYNYKYSQSLQTSHTAYEWITFSTVTVTVQLHTMLAWLNPVNGDSIFPQNIRLNGFTSQMIVLFNILLISMLIFVVLTY
jgi:hypothetical protein